MPVVSTVKTRPNHYETLGLKPTASEEEIAQAFARAMRLPHRVAEVAQIGIAFDTLRNPAKRRAHDEALGLSREPEARVVPSAMSFRASAHFAAMSLRRIEHEVRAPLEPAVPLKREAPPQPQAAAEPEAAAEPVKIDLLAGFERGAEQERERPRQTDADRWLEPPIPDFLATGRAARIRDTDERVVDWRYPAFAIGSLIVAVVLIGAWAGAHAQDGGAAQQELTVALPKARPQVNGVAPSPAPTTATVDAQPFAAPPAQLAADRIRHVRSLPRTTESENRPAEIGQSLATAAAPDIAAPESTSDQAAVEAPAAPAIAASLPLPKVVIARTIERIGYSCGEVASATASGPGAYKITCTSGQSYQAKPVRGRYHFRRW